ncbi:hypothetical protein L1S35_06545 [Flavobacterium sp. AS60]|uniref:ABC-three component system protein n=1 Tax=Flavobacterium anseongense TaxID=2910677 RepID=UPI001F3ADEE2|nr:ABC-three component system protein [Flavobacterium sp. AS60]MCF6129325.1 hypothetical protein [Flavobacterium sp. AS60]
MQNFKQYSVIIDGGTGVLFQPMTEEYFYILTAKHNLQIKPDQAYIDKEDNTDINILRFIFEDGTYTTEKIPFTLLKNQNYFPHINPAVDSAILKIRFDEYKIFEIKNLYVYEDTSIDNNTCVCGFPDDKRKANAENPHEQFTNYKISQSSNDTQYKKSVRLTENQSQETISGMSGGGIVKLGKDHYLLIGIQSQMTRTISPQNEIDFIPIRFFTEIIEHYRDSLSPLLPPYLANFSFLRDNAFNINAGPDDSDIQYLRNFLKAKTTNVIESDITPIAIKEYFKERLLLDKNDTKNLSDESIYCCWLEYLVIMNIAKEKNHSLNELEELFDKVRLIYKNTNTEWHSENFLKECMNCDFSNLAVDGTILINTSILPHKTTQVHHYKINKGSLVPNIDFLRKEHLNGEFGNVFIDNGSGETQEFVFDRFTFIHFAFLKQYMLVENSHDFREYNANNSPELVTKLKTLYGELFNL